MQVAFISTTIHVDCNPDVKIIIQTLMFLRMRIYVARVALDGAVTRSIARWTIGEPGARERALQGVSLQAVRINFN